MRNYIFVSLILALLSGFVQPAMAHIIKTDGTISIMLHTSPADDPIITRPADLLFFVTDDTDGFTLARCDCTVTIALRGHDLFNGQPQPIEGLSVYSFHVPFTFPETAVYGIAVVGNPKIAKAFQSFKVQYDLRVDREPPRPPIFSYIETPTAGGVALAVGVCLTVIYFRRRAI